MKFQVVFIAGAAAGYVLGAKAGRERYEQIRRATQAFAENPTVRDAAGTVRSRGGDVAEAARERAREKAGDLVGAARERMPGQRSEADGNRTGPTPVVPPPG